MDAAFALALLVAGVTRERSGPLRASRSALLTFVFAGLAAVCAQVVLHARGVYAWGSPSLGALLRPARRRRRHRHPGCGSPRSAGWRRPRRSETTALVGAADPARRRAHARGRRGPCWLGAATSVARCYRPGPGPGGRVRRLVASGRPGRVRAAGLVPRAGWSARSRSPPSWARWPNRSSTPCSATRH